MLDAQTRTRTRSIPATSLVAGQVIHWRYLYKATDDRRLVKRVWSSKSGTIYAETVDADITDRFAQERTLQSWPYDKTDMVTVEVEL